MVFLFVKLLIHISLWLVGKSNNWSSQFPSPIKAVITSTVRCHCGDLKSSFRENAQSSFWHIAVSQLCSIMVTWLLSKYGEMNKMSWTFLWSKSYQIIPWTFQKCHFLVLSVTKTCDDYFTHFRSVILPLRETKLISVSLLLISPPHPHSLSPSSCFRNNLYTHIRLKRKPVFADSYLLSQCGSDSQPYEVLLI